MRKILLLAAIGLAALTPAEAARCPHGQILRVSMNRCVGLHSKLAAGFVRSAVAYTHVRASSSPAPRGSSNPSPARFGSAGSVATAAKPSTTAAFDAATLETLRERLAHPQRPLDAASILLSRASALVEE